jgi:very-short-patch-repair endonuclease
VATSHTLAVTLEWKKTKREVIYEVLRFWDHEVFRETEFVLQRIADVLAARGTE